MSTKLKMMHFYKLFALITIPVFAIVACNKNGNISHIDPQTPVEGSKDVEVWITKANERIPG